MIRFACPSCSTSLSVADARSGQDYRCPSCNQRTRIPASTSAGRSESIGGAPPVAVGAGAASDLFETVAGTAPGSAEPTTPDPQQSIASMPTCAGEPAPAPAPADGKAKGTGPAVPGYEVLGVLGRGGMGVVYKARQVGLNRLVALKMILGGGHAGSVELARFRAEAEAVARLQHPNIVQVYEVGEQNDLPFFSLEFVDGGPLDKRLQGTPLPPRDAARLTETLARAIHSAHERGIVHRDLKPANILLGRDVAQGPHEASPHACALYGQSCIPKIADFGLAKQLDSSELGQTRTGAIMGTPSYMAPEQAAGKVKEIGPLADVYALGALLYEFLTGRPPFKGATVMDTVLMVVHDEPVAPSKLQPRLPRDLESICLRCLEKEPGRRYPSALAVADDLHRFLQGEPTRARPVSNWERGWKWARRRPAVAGLLVASLVAGTALIALVVGAFFWTKLQTAWQSEQEMRLVAQDKQHEAQRQEALAVAEKREADRQRHEAHKQRLLALEQRALVRQLLYLAQIGLVDREVQNGQFEEALARLRGQAPDKGQEDLRGFEWYHLYRLADRRLCQYAGHPLSVNGVAFSPDGLVAFSADSDGMVGAWDARSGQPLQSIKTGNPVAGLAQSGDGRRLATTAGRTIKVWDARLGKELQTYSGHNQLVGAVAFSRDGSRLVSGSSDATVKIWDAKSAKDLLTFRRHTSAVRAVAFRPDGRQVASADGGQLLLWNPDTGDEGIFLRGHAEPVNCVAFSGDGAWLASASDDATVKVWDTRSGQERLSFRGHRGPVLAVACSPAGKLAASGGAEGTVKLWDLQTGQDLLTIHGHRERVNAVAFDRDGELLASASSDRTAKVWNVDLKRVASRLPGLPETAVQLVFSPDGRLVAAAGAQNVRVWDVRTGKDRSGPSARRSVAFNADGKLAAAADGRNIRVWEARTGTPMAQWPAQANVRSVLYSKDGSRLASLDDDGSVAVWEPTGKPLLTLFRFTPGADQLMISSDGQRLAACGGDDWNCKLGDAQTGSVILNLSGATQQVVKASFSPDGQRLATASFVGILKIWDSSSGKLSRSWKADRAPIDFVTFSPDGRQLLSGDAAGLQIWNAETGARLRFVPGGKRAVFSPDGERLAVSDGDHIKLYDARTGQEILTLGGQAGTVAVIAFSPDGHALASAAADRIIRIWGGALER